MSFAIRTFIPVTSLMLTLEAAIFLAKGNLGLSAENIALLASTRWGYNPDLVLSLAQQRSDTWVGVVLLLLAFALQMGNALWPSRWGDFRVHEGGAVSALVFSIFLGIGALSVSEYLATETAESVKAILAALGVT